MTMSLRKRARPFKQRMARYGIACLAGLIPLVMLYRFFAGSSSGSEQFRPALLSLTGSNGSGIPKIIHQSWKNKDIPPHFKAWGETWKEHHPDWEYRMWTDDDNRALIVDHYPWFLPTYDGFKANIMRADASRVFYMLHYGGLYVDGDFECLKNVEPLLNGRQVVLGRMGSDANMRNSIPNAFMASAPGHPFWLYAAARMASGPPEGSDSTMQAEFTTGPGMFWFAVEDYKAAARLAVGSQVTQSKQMMLKAAAAAAAAAAASSPLPPTATSATAAGSSKSQLFQSAGAGQREAAAAAAAVAADLGEEGSVAPGFIVLPSKYLYPYSWLDGKFDAALKTSCEGADAPHSECKKRFPGAYAITYWTHSWGR